MRYTRHHTTIQYIFQFIQLLLCCFQYILKNIRLYIDASRTLALGNSCRPRLVYVCLILLLQCLEFESCLFIYCISHLTWVSTIQTSLGGIPTFPTAHWGFCNLYDISHILIKILTLMYMQLLESSIEKPLSWYRFIDESLTLWYALSHMRRMTAARQKVLIGVGRFGV
jgi:hypothetical protein